jgi:hypothetical protein
VEELPPVPEPPVPVPCEPPVPLPPPELAQAEIRKRTLAPVIESLAVVICLKMPETGNIDPLIGP